MRIKKLWCWFVGGLALIGGLSLVLIGAFNWDILRILFGSWTWVLKTLYISTGLGGIVAGLKCWRIF